MTKCEMGLSEVLLPLALSLMTLYGFFLDDKLFEKEVQCKHYDQHFEHYLPRMLRPVLSDKIWFIIIVVTRLWFLVGRLKWTVNNFE